MGGRGSTRWGWHNKKTPVEDCHKMTIFSFKPYLSWIGTVGTLRWSRGDRETGSIGYHIVGLESPEKINLVYTISDRLSGEKTNYDYYIQLQTTPLPWGGVRYWFTCPLVIDFPCLRRVGVLYLPPGGKYFGCRHCYNLTYQSSQESGKFDRFYAELATSMQESHPGITGKDIEYILSREKGEAPKGFYRRRMKNHPYEYIPPDPYTGYLTPDELCQQSGLSPERLVLLKTARLLLPDTKDGRYRPKLVGWARKMSYLLGEGWELDEIKRWADGRWSTPDPSTFPPSRDDWME